MTNVFVLAPSYERIFLTQWWQVAKKNNNNNNKLSKQITRTIIIQSKPFPFCPFVKLSQLLNVKCSRCHELWAKENILSV